MTRAWIATGANLGRRAEQIEAALEALRADPRVEGLVASPLVETDPVGGPPGQPRFLNGVCRLEFDGEAEELLALLHELEDRVGRRREVRDGPRPLDLDLLFFGDRRSGAPGLRLPHPRLEERAFVLEPLAALAPDLRLPRCGLTVAQRLAQLR